MTKRKSRILQGAKEALAYVKGEANPEEYGLHIPPMVDVREIRMKHGLSQKEFALRYGFTYGRIRDWEQGRSNIDAPSRILLTIIEKEPEAVERALSAA